MRVLHVSQPVAAGVAEVVAALVPRQIEEGWDVVVACPAGGGLAERVRAAGGRHVVWEARRSPGWSVFGEGRRLARLLHEVDPDVVHLHSSKAGLVGRFVVRGRRATIFQPHAWSFLALGGTAALAARRMERFASRWADAVICGSIDEREVGQAAGVRAAWHVVPNSVDVGRFDALTDADRAAARERLGLGDGPIAVCVGRLCAQKGQDLLLDAWSAVVDQVPGALLVLVGDGPDQGILMSRSPAGVVFAGWADDVVPWLAAADVVVQPSRYETLSLSVLEAMASARSVVVSDAGGTREAVEGPPGGRPCGAVVPVGDAAALARALAIRLADAGRSTDEGRAARERVVAEFGASAWAERILAVTRSVAAHRHSAG